MWTRLLLASGLFVLFAAGHAAAAPLRWVTLGTAGGPVVTPSRSQPANMIIAGERHWLVDCGDGCLERVAALGLQPGAVDRLFISHLHLDHVAGLQGLIGLRWMQNAPGVLTVYGPPGTDTMVAGILASMNAVTGLDPAQRHRSPSDTVHVVILSDASDQVVDGIRVRTVRNAHFDASPGHPAANGSQSLTYRFDLDGYGVGFTGDSGVSPAMTALFTGAALIVSEVIDLAAVVADLGSAHSPIPAAAQAGLIEHMRTQHLTPRQVGAMAQRAGSRSVVLTHLGITGPTDAAAAALVAQTRETFSGDVRVARDLDRF